MGVPQRPHGHKYYDNRPAPGFSFPSPALLFPTSFPSRIGEKHTTLETVNSSIPGKENNKKNRGPRTSIPFQIIPHSKKRWLRQAYNRLACSKFIPASSEVQNGNPREDFKVHYRRPLRRYHRLKRRVLFSANSVEFPKILRIYNRQHNLRLPIHAIRPCISALGIHKNNKTNPQVLSPTRNNELLPIRRFPDPSPLRGGSSSESPSNHPKIPITRLYNKLEEIEPDSIPIFRISGSHPTPRPDDSVPTKGQDKPDLGSVQHLRDPNFRLPSRARISHRLVKLRSQVSTSGKTSSTSLNEVDERPHSPHFQRLRREPQLLIQKIPPPLERPNLPVHICSNSYSYPPNYPYDRCKPFGLGRYFAPTRGFRHMAKTTSQEVNELARIEKHTSISPAFSPKTEKQTNSAPYRQLNSRVLHKKTGISEITTTPCLNHSDPSDLLAKRDHLSSQAPPGVPERPCGLGLSSKTIHRRMVPGRRDVRSPLGEVRSIWGRPVCQQVQQPNSNIHFAIPRPASSRRECPQPRLEPMGKDICLPSSSNTSGCSPKTPPLPRKRGAHRPVSPLRELVHLSSDEMSPPLSSPSFSRSVPNNQNGNSTPPRSAKLLPSRLETLKQAIRAKGIPPDCTDIIGLAHKKSTIKQYQIIWTKFLEFLTLRNCPEDEIQIGTVCDFLFLHLVQYKREYRTLATYKCALRLPLLYALEVEIKCLTVELFMRGSFAFHPPLKAKQMPSWSLDGVLRYLQSEPFEPLETASDSCLLQKTVFLILLSSGRRIGEISNLSTSTFIDKSLKRLKIKWLIGFTPKHYTPEFSPESPSIKELKLNNEISTLCPVRALRIYLERTALWRSPASPGGSLAPLWIKRDRSSPYSIIELSNVFTNLIKFYRRDARLSLKIQIGPHNTRKFGGSYSLEMGTEIKTIIKVMGFSSPSILKKNYSGSVPPLTIPCSLPGGIYVPKPESHTSDSNSG